MLTEKERLEEELKLLEESFSLDVITKQEYEDAKQRIEAKLDELDVLEQKKEESEVKEDIKEEQKTRSFPTSKSKDFEEPKPKEEKPEVEKEPKPEVEKEKKIEIKEVELKKEAAEEKEQIKEEPVKEEAIKGLQEEQKKLEDIKEAEKKATEELKEETTVEEVKEKEEKPVEEEKKEELESIPKPEEEQPEIISEEGTGINKKIFASIAIIVILILGLWYVFFLEKTDVDDASIEPADNILSLIACSSDDECIEKGKIGICNNPGEENAECEYIEDVKVELMVLNSDNCFNCRTGRVLSILNGFFPNIGVEKIDFETEEGRDVAEKFDIIALPAYIFNSSFTEAYNYDKLSSSFNEVDDSFVMKNTVANANYYINREEIPNKLDLFFKSDQNASLKAEENLQEFLEAFDGEVNFTKHNEDSEIIKELGINTFPAFLINNKIKFSGVQSADKIRENFCHLNSVTECTSGLSKSLV